MTHEVNHHRGWRRAETMARMLASFSLLLRMPVTMAASARQNAARGGSYIHRFPAA